MRKILSIISVLLIGTFLLTGCGKKEDKPNINEPINQEENQEEVINAPVDPSVGKTKLGRENNKIITTMNNGTGVTKTEYTFENDVLVSGKVIEEYVDEDVANSIYNSIKNEEAIYNQYSDITVEGKSIVLTMKEETLTAFTGMGQDAMYELLEKTYPEE